MANPELEAETEALTATAAIINAAALDVAPISYEEDRGSATPAEVFDALEALTADNPGCSEFVVLHHESDRIGILRRYTEGNTTRFWFDLPLEQTSNPAIAGLLERKEEQKNKYVYQWLLISPSIGSVTSQLDAVEHAYPTFYEYLIAYYRIEPVDTPSVD